MTTRYDCAEVEALAGAIALGEAGEAERDAYRAHIAGCRALPAPILAASARSSESWRSRRRRGEAERWEPDLRAARGRRREYAWKWVAAFCRRCARDLWGACDREAGDGRRRDAGGQLVRRAGSARHRRAQHPDGATARTSGRVADGGRVVELGSQRRLTGDDGVRGELGRHADARSLHRDQKLRLSRARPGRVPRRIADAFKRGNTKHPTSQGNKAARPKSGLPWRTGRSSIALTGTCASTIMPG